MSTIVTRTVKGAPLTWAEADANFNNLNTDKQEAADVAAAIAAAFVTETGTSVQPYSAVLDEYAAVNPTAAGLALLDDADNTAQRATLGLVIGTNVQAYDADLTTWAGVTPGTGVATALAVNVGSAGAVALEGAWTDYGATSTIVGFSAFTVKEIYYKDIGKTRFVTFKLAGTSNSVNTTFTVPTASSNTAEVNGYCRAYDNGAEGASGMAVITANSATVTLYKSALGAWTGSGDKLVAGQFTYQLP